MPRSLLVLLLLAAMTVPLNSCYEGAQETDPGAPECDCFWQDGSGPSSAYLECEAHCHDTGEVLLTAPVPGCLGPGSRLTQCEADQFCIDWNVMAGDEQLGGVIVRDRFMRAACVTPCQSKDDCQLTEECVRWEETSDLYCRPLNSQIPTTHR